MESNQSYDLEKQNYTANIFLSHLAHPSLKTLGL